jgi:hypothetical protein
VKWPAESSKIRRQQVFLGVDVVVEAALEDADLVGDILDRRRRVSLLVEDAHRRLDHVIVAVTALSTAGCLRLGRRHHCRFAVNVAKCSGDFI